MLNLLERILEIFYEVTFIFATGYESGSALLKQLQRKAEKYKHTTLDLTLCKKID